MKSFVRNFCFTFLLFFCSSSLVLAADALLEKSKDVFAPIPDKPPVIKGNPATPEKIDLGKMLYFDPRLSASYLISCNTCHNLGMGGGDLQETSVGHGWQKGPRNAPTVLNAVFNIAQFWDGRAKDLAEQAKGPVQASVEMNNTPENLIKTLKSIPEYVARFKKAFPEDKDSVSFDNTAKAIEVFEATLITPNSSFDKFLKGDTNALNKEQKEGLQLFIDKGCADCHNGVNVGGQDYFPFGLVEKPNEEVRPTGDLGRFQVTQLPEDKYTFRAPSLRNLDLTPPYFHSGKIWEISDSVAVMGTAQLGMELKPEEVKKVVEFLKSLTGDQPKVVYPILPPNSKTTPRPELTVVQKKH